MKDYKEEVIAADFHGQEVKLFTLENSTGDKVSISNYGATLTRWQVMHDEGELEDYILTYDTFEEFVEGTDHRGGVCGPVANRIANGEFRLHDQFYKLDKHGTQHVCHSGHNGIDQKVWECVGIEKDEVHLRLQVEHLSDQFPGDRTFDVRYLFSEDRSLQITYSVETTEDTIINLTNHAYFTLGEEPAINDLFLEVNASYFTPVDALLIPTGEVLKVDNTGFDFRSARVLSVLENSDDERIRRVGGLDHNFLVDAEERGELRYAGRVINKKKGVQLVCYTTEPGMQVYTQIIDKHADVPSYRAICLETQNVPDAINVSHFPSPVLRSGDRYESNTIYSVAPYVDED